MRFPQRCGYCIVPIFMGHGIGTFFHGPPDIYHCLNNYPGIMQAGQVFTIEPVVGEGERRVYLHEDGWTYLTQVRYRLTALTALPGPPVPTCSPETAHLYPPAHLALPT